MSSTKLIRLLQTLSEDEVKAFGAWLRSPWCNSNKSLIRLFDQLKKHYPDFTDRKLTKEKLFYQVLPEGKFTDRRMNNLLSEAYLAAEKFLSFRRFDQEDYLQQELLLKELQERRLDDWFFKAAYREIDRLENQEVKGSEDHLALFRLHSRLYYHPNSNLRIRADSLPVADMGAQLDLRYVLEKAAIINEMISRPRIFQQEDYDIEMELNRWQITSEGLQHPAVALYRLRFAYTLERTPGHYWQLRGALLDSLDQLGQQEQMIHLLSLINDTISLIKSGVLDITESLPLYHLGLQLGVLLQQGKLTYNTYSTIVIAGNSKGDFAFTDQFIADYTPYLDETIRDDSYHWARAHTAYWQRDLESCLDILQAHEFKSAHFQLICRVLNAQVYFDLFLLDDTYRFFLFNFLDAFEKWLSREKSWSKQNKVSFIRFVQTCRQLARYFSAPDFKSEKVENLLEKEANIQALNWLKQKSAEVLMMRRQ